MKNNGEEEKIIVEEKENDFERRWKEKNELKGGKVDMREKMEVERSGLKGFLIRRWKEIGLRIEGRLRRIEKDWNMIIKRGDKIIED